MFSATNGGYIESQQTKMLCSKREKSRCRLSLFLTLAGFLVRHLLMLKIVVIPLTGW
jgi:hypothetical protein